MLACVEAIVRGNSSDLLEERRCVERLPFVRPVTIRSGEDRERVTFAFSRDVSPLGIGMISQVAWDERIRARLEVHSTRQCDGFAIWAEVRWTRAYGERWFFTGWRFLDE